MRTFAGVHRVASVVAEEAVSKIGVLQHTSRGDEANLLSESYKTIPAGRAS